MAAHHLTDDLPTAEYLRSRLLYVESTGALLWLPRTDISPPSRCRTWNTKWAGAQAGTADPPSSSGRRYVRIKINDRNYLAHRLIWVLQKGEWPDRDVDHRDGDGLNNRWRNLRLATVAQNLANARKRRNRTGYKGVRFHKASGRYQARIHIEGREVSLGYYDTPEEAHAVYADQARRVFGEFARPD